MLISRDRQGNSGVFYMASIKMHLNNDIKRKSRELELMHSNAYKSFIKV